MIILVKVRDDGNSQFICNAFSSSEMLIECLEFSKASTVTSLTFSGKGKRQHLFLASSVGLRWKQRRGQK